MVFNMKRKEIILGVIGIVVIVVVAFFIANMVHDNINSDDNNKQEEKKEEKFEVDGEKVNFKTYRVDSSFFLNVPDTFTMLDEATLKRH